jgi:hypothetical protein
LLDAAAPAAESQTLYSSWFVWSLAVHLCFFMTASKVIDHLRTTPIQINHILEQSRPEHVLVLVAGD